MRLSNIHLKLLAAILLLAFPATAFSGTRLSVNKAGDGVLEIVLSNSEPVAAIQFTVNTDGVSLFSIESGPRLLGGWMVSSHRMSDTQINVVLIRSGQNNLPEGEGVIARLTVRASASGSVSLSRVVLASPDAQSIPTIVVNLEWSETPATLGQNFPNPFNPTTTIPYTVEEHTTVSLAVYDVSGREIKRMFNEQKAPGSYQAIWNGTDETGFQVPSGVYFVRLEAGPTVLTKKMILTK